LREINTREFTAVKFIARQDRVQHPVQLPELPFFNRLAVLWHVHDSTLTSPLPGLPRSARPSNQPTDAVPRLDQATGQEQHDQHKEQAEDDQMKFDPLHR
jgi:hypothetical protein